MAHRLILLIVFAPSEPTCTPDGLTPTLADREGAVLDKLPNDGHLRWRTTPHRTNGFLILRLTQETSSRMSGLIPQSFRRVRWFRFAEVAGQ